MSYGIKFVGTSWTKIMRQKLYFKVTFLRRPRVANFANIIKTEITFFKTTLMNSKRVEKRVERIRKYA